MDLERARRRKAEDENRLLKEAAIIANASSNSNSKKLAINTTVTHTNENIISPTTENIKLKKKISKFATSEKQMLSTLEQRLVDLNDARAKVHHHYHHHHHHHYHYHHLIITDIIAANATKECC